MSDNDLAGASDGWILERLSKGDLIQFDSGGRHDTDNPHRVMVDEMSGSFLTIEGPGGATKMMVQNKHDSDRISVMSMGSRSDHGEWISNLRVVGRDYPDESDS